MMIELSTYEFILAALSGAVLGGSLVAWWLGGKIRLYQMWADRVARNAMDTADELARLRRATNEQKS